MEEESKKKARRQFDQEFKKDAVRLVETSNLSVEKVARELSIPKATLSNWWADSSGQRNETG